MDGRITHAATAEGRIAAVCRSLILKFAKPIPNRPDYADLDEWLKIYLEREFLLERIDEGGIPQTPEHQEILRSQLVLAEAEIAKQGL